MATQVRLTVTIDTDTGRISKTSDPVTLAGDIFTPPDGIVTYPDLRVSLFTFEYSTDAVNYNPGFQFDGTPAVAQGFSYTNCGDLDFSGSPTSPAAPDADVLLDVDHRRIIASEVLSPRVYFARRLAYIEDRVMAFAYEQMDLAGGQFGTYPLVVFGETSMWAASPGSADMAFAQVDPVNEERGIVGRYAHTFADNVLYFADKSGIFAVDQSPQAAPISLPIRSLLTLGKLTHLGTLKETATYGTQVWISDGAGPGTVLGFASGIQMWYTLARPRIGFGRGADYLVGFDSGSILNETLDAGTDITSFYLTSGLQLQDPGQMKRFRWFQVRFGAGTVTSIALDIKEGSVDFFGGLLNLGTNEGRTQITNVMLAIKPTVEVVVQAKAGFRLNSVHTDYLIHASHRVPIVY